MMERERALAAIRGEVLDRIPWVPRLDFWYRAALRKGTMPKEWRGLRWRRLRRHLGAGVYALNPNYTWMMTGTVDRGLGLCTCRRCPYDFELDGVERRISKRESNNATGNDSRVCDSGRHCTNCVSLYRRDVGCRRLFAWVSELPIRKPEDFAPVGYLFEHIKVKPQPSGYLALRDKVGDQGVRGGLHAGFRGAHASHHEAIDVYRAILLCDGRLSGKDPSLAEQMGPFFEAVQQTALDSPAEVVYLGGNYDDSLTPPPLFRKHIAPVLKQYAERLHARGKYLLTHTDGENRRLISLFLEAGFDVADSVCPYPMTQVNAWKIFTRLLPAASRFGEAFRRPSSARAVPMMRHSAAM